MNLQAGDEVSIIAPASPLRTTDGHHLRLAVSLLESWGLRTQVRVDHTNYFYMAGPDSARAEHLNAALADPDCRAIFCLRGGYGSPRLLPYLDTALRPKRKMLVGSSDVTALHAALGHLWPDIDLIYGPNVATNQLLGQTSAAEANRRSLYDLLFVPPVSITETLRFIRPGAVSGPMVGGCLSLLVTLLGTKYDLPTAGKILFIEEVGEPPYKVDRMLTHLRNARKLESVRGVVFGEMYNCRDAHNDIWDVLKDIFQHDNFPVAFGLRNGHGEINLSIRMGADVELDSANSTLRFI